MWWRISPVDSSVQLMNSAIIINCSLAGFNEATTPYFVDTAPHFSSVPPRGFFSSQQAELWEVEVISDRSRHSVDCTPRAPGPEGWVINNSRPLLLQILLRTRTPVNCFCLIWHSEGHPPLHTLGHLLPPPEGVRAARQLTRKLRAKCQSGICLRDMLVQHDIMTALTFYSLMLHMLLCIRICFCKIMNFIFFIPSSWPQPPTQMMRIKVWIPEDKARLELSDRTHLFISLKWREEGVRPATTIRFQ